MFERLKKAMKFCVCHHGLYGGLCASHSWAAWATQKPEVYLPMVLLYAVLAWRG